MTDREIQEIKDEMREEMLAEAREEERKESLLRSDYEFFLDSIDDDIEELAELFKNIIDKHIHYGWYVEADDILNQLKGLSNETV